MNRRIMSFILTFALCLSMLPVSPVTAYAAEGTTIGASSLCEPPAEEQPAGEYEINVSGAVADNYDFTYVKGTMSVADHQHVWTYTAEGSTITAKCGNAATCPDQEQSFTLNAPDTDYSGEMVNAEVSRDGMDLTFKLHYTGTNYDSDGAPINAGDYTVTLTVGDKSVSDTFTINPKDISVSASCQFSLSENSFTYTGKAPELTVNAVDTGVGSYTMQANTDYTVGTAQVDAGSYGLTVTGMGNYTGTVKLDYTISAREVSIIDAGIQAVDYDPNGYTLTVNSVTFSGVVEGETLTYTAAAKLTGTNGVGTRDAEVTVTLENSNYVLKQETVSGTVTINRAAGIVTAVPTAKTLTYDGSEQELVYSGTAAGGTMMYSLTESGNYSVTVPTGTDAGNYTVWYYVDGDDNHNDSAKASVGVTIAQADISRASVTVSGDYTYDGTAQTPETSNVTVRLTLNGVEKTLEHGGDKDYTYAVSNNISAGTATVTVTGKGNYTGTATGIFEIGKATALTVNIPTATDIEYGQTLSASALSDTDWRWVDGTTVPGSSGSYEAYLPVNDTNYDYSKVTGYDAATHRVIRGISVVVGKTTPAITVTATPASAISGKTITVNATVKNPHNESLSDLPTPACTYKIGENGTEQTFTGFFAIPENTATGTTITITATTAANRKYVAGTGTGTVIVTDCTHTGNKTLQYDNASHWYICGDCKAEVDKAAHSGGTATCKDKATCTDCEQTYGDLNSSNHAGGTKIRGKADATPTAAGYTGGGDCHRNKGDH